MTEFAIRAERLGKRYPLAEGNEPYRTLRDTIMDVLRSPIAHRHARRGRGEIWALQDVSLEVEQGEVVGLIGRNGAGKSTLLKLLARVTRPTRGRAWIRGRLGCLLEVGSGFHRELTGRENIQLNGAILGMTRLEIAQKFDEIVEFAEVERFLDTPVKHYSTGMAMRLAFSVAAHLEPDILLIDEVLAVGDAAFQKKCLGRMGTVAREGRTVLFVSHNIQAILALCPRSLLLQAGTVVDQGPTPQVVQRYLEAQGPAAEACLDGPRSRSGDGSATIVSLRIESTDEDAIIRPTSRLKIVIGYRSDQTVRYPQFVVSIHDMMNVGIFVLHNEFVGGLPDVLPAEGSVTCLTEPINLTPGRCVVHVELLKGNVRADFVSYAAYFDVEADASYGPTALPRDWALCQLKHEWVLNDD